MATALPVRGGPLVDDARGDRGDLVVAQPDRALGLHPVDDRVQPAHRVRATGGGVVVGGVVERLDQAARGDLRGQVGPPGLLQ